MKIIKLLTIAIISVLLCSCNSGQKKRSAIPYVEYSEDGSLDYETINVPFVEQHGVKYVSAKINGVSVDMIFDTGCSQTLISLLEAKMLAKRGLLTDDDYLGTSRSAIADGSIVEDMVFNVKTLELTDGERIIKCDNVVVQVSNNVAAPVLLGNEVLDRVASYTIDNDAKIIKFKLK
ncbi:MAG: retroviral-like aspartic protease family protein [Bacteroidales bacterium]|nr:retroviral-like aspartic protease family protein [Bacteroidales bacterium]